MTHSATSIRKHPRMTDYAESVADRTKREHREQVRKVVKSVAIPLVLILVYWSLT